MAGRIYLINENAELVSLEESDYRSEDLLQRLLAKHPDLLAGDLMEIEGLYIPPDALSRRPSIEFSVVHCGSSCYKRARFCRRARD